MPPPPAALEPHSALPTAIPAAFGARSALLPPALAGRSHGLVSSACFRVRLCVCVALGRRVLVVMRVDLCVCVCVCVCARAHVRQHNCASATTTIDTNNTTTTPTIPQHHPITTTHQQHKQHNQFPLVRHLYYWWGFRPVTRRAMARVLRSGRAAVVVPGGVRECLEMDATGRSEVALLRRRTGFIRLAMQCGADVVPAFAFGQTATYRWLLPGPPLVPRRLVRALARRVGFAPMLLLGRGGSPAPLRSKLTVVVGKPLGLPACEAPTDAEVRAWLEAFIKELAALFERHKAAAGHPELMLRVL